MYLSIVSIRLYCSWASILPEILIFSQNRPKPSNIQAHQQEARLGFMGHRGAYVDTARLFCSWDLTWIGTGPAPLVDGEEPDVRLHVSEAGHAAANGVYQ